MQATTPNPTVSMSFIAGLLILMSIFSILGPKSEVSSEQDNSQPVTVSQVEMALYSAY